MAEMPTETPAAPARVTDEGKPSPAVKPAADKPRRRNNGLLWLVVIALAAAGGWFGYQQQMALISVEQRLSAESPVGPGVDLAPLEQAQAELGESLNAQAEALEALRAAQPVDQAEALTTLGQQLADVDQRVTAMAGVSREDWKLAEAEFLLRLANQRVLVGHNTREALALTQAADDILRQQDDPALFTVRQTLATEITSLKLVEPVDREGTYLRLEAVIAASVQLIIPRTYEAAPVELDPPAADQVNSGLWNTMKASVARALAALGQLVQVRRHDQSVQPLLAPQTEYFVRQNLRLMLEQAQAALLQARPRVYHQSLVKAEDWLSNYFALNSETEALVAEIRALQTVPVAVNPPKLNEALALLKAYIDRLHRVGSEAAP